MQTLRLHYLAIFLTLLFCSASVSAADFDQREYSLKAVFLERFTRFISWPDTHNNSEMFIISIIGNPEFASLLKEVYKTKKIQGKSVIIREIEQPEQIEDSHLLFIGQHTSEALAEILKHASTTPVLTASDTENYAKQGVMINFYMSKKQKIRFEINERATKAAGFHISYKLLSLAKIVETE